MTKNIFFIILLILSIIFGVFIVSKTTIFRSKASGNQGASISNSYLFASPIQAKADGQEKIRITIFLLDSNGLGVSQKNVHINTPGSLTISSIQPITDDFGKAVFDLSSPVPGKYLISASTDTFTLSQKINILFL